MSLPVDIDKRSSIPLYVQLAQRLRLLVREGRLKTGDALPTVRALAVQLQINANTVARVYRDLQSEGVLRLERGSGTFVADTSPEPAGKRDFEQIERKVHELIRLGKQLGMRAPELSQFIESRWKEVGDASRQ